MLKGQPITMQVALKDLMFVYVKDPLLCRKYRVFTESFNRP